MFDNLRFTRRGLMLLVAGASTQSRFRLYAASSDFWNKKEPAEWSSEEIDKLLTKSPWAKEVMVTSAGMSRGGGRNGGGIGDPGIGGGYPGGGTGYPGGYPGGGGPGAGGYPRGMGGPGMGGGRRGAGEGPMPVSYRATVRWESAKPVLEALKTSTPEGLAGDYIISVRGVPVIQQGRQHSDDGETDTTISKGLNDEVLDRIKSLTYLEPKGKSPAQPAVVQKGPISSTGMPTLLFGFPRDVVALTAVDKEVLFTTRLGTLDVRAKFNLKEMTYHNELAL